MCPCQRGEVEGQLCQLLQVSILTYLVVWLFLVKKGYPASSPLPAEQRVTRVTGVTFISTSLELREQRWSVVHDVIPPWGENVYYHQRDCDPPPPTPNQWQETDGKGKRNTSYTRVCTQTHTHRHIPFFFF